MSARPWAVVALLAVTPAVGCDKNANSRFSQVGSTIGAAAPVADAKPAAAPAPAFRQAPQADAAPAGGGKPAAPAEPPIERKIIFNGGLEVVVKEFDAARKQLTELVAERGGYFAKTEVTGAVGSRRAGTFSIKVPAEKFQNTVDAIAALGSPVRNSTDSQDVTEEFVDVAARVRNLKAEEEVLNKLLQTAAGRLDEVFKIREQIRLNREQIERAEGRLKALTALTSLSTITLTLREDAEYVPPPVESAPTFSARVGSTFGESFGLLRRTAEAIALGLTAAAPWLPFVAVAALLLRRLARRPAVAPRA